MTKFCMVILWNFEVHDIGLPSMQHTGPASFRIKRYGLHKMPASGEISQKKSQNGFNINLNLYLCFSNAEKKSIAFRRKLKAQNRPPPKKKNFKVRPPLKLS